MDTKTLKSLVKTHENLAADKNKLTDNVFYITFINQQDKSMKLDVGFEELDDLSKLIMRHNIVEILGGYYENGELRATEYQLEEISYGMCQLVTFLCKQNIKDVQTITLETLFEWLSTYISEKHYFAYGTIKLKAIAINKLINKTRSGECIFPVIENISYSTLQETLISSMKLYHPYTNIYEWLDGGSLDTSSIETALILLQYALQELNSPKYHVLNAWFKTVKEFAEQNNNFFGLFKPAANADRNSSLPASTKFFFKNKKIPTIKDLHPNAISEDYKKKFATGSIKFLERWYELSLTYTDSINSLEDFHKVVFEWTHGSINSLTVHFYQCSLAILTILNGYRSSELSSISPTPIDKKSGVLYLTSNIKKTHSGLPVKRSTADAISIAVDACLDLSLIDKTQPIIFNDDEVYLNLFATTTNYQWITNYNDYLQKFLNPQNNISTVLRRDTANNWLKKIYKKAISKLPRSTQTEFEDAGENISIHAFRHTFVDFLLRRFDGDVIPAIRHCFAHSSSDPMNYVINYLRTKVAPQVQRTAERAYTNELIMRIAGDHSRSQFSGHAVDYIHRELEKFEYSTIEELDDIIHEWVFNDMIRLVPHSYGYCMLFKGRENIARCKDTKADVRKSENGESKYCLGCPNLAVHIKSHFEVLEQLKAVHLQLLADSENPNNILSLFKKSKESDIQMSEQKIIVIDDLLKNKSGA